VVLSRNATRHAGCPSRYAAGRVPMVRLASGSGRRQFVVKNPRTTSCRPVRSKGLDLVRQPSLGGLCALRDGREQPVPWPYQAGGVPGQQRSHASRFASRGCPRSGGVCVSPARSQAGLMFP